MRKGTRSIKPGTTLFGLVLVLALSGPLLSITACENLSSDTTTATAVIPASVAETTAAEGAASEASIFGTWDGTYTPLAIWDQNGTIENPPIPLNVPVGMRLELYPLSAATGDCGTVEIPGYRSSRVVALSIDGQNVQLAIVSEAQGLDDLRSVFTLTLEGDTLTGEDSGDPAVPRGWVSTSGTLLLTRTSLSYSIDSEPPGGEGAGGHTGAATEEPTATTATESTTPPVHWGAPAP